MEELDIDGGEEINDVDDDEIVELLIDEILEEL